MFYHLSSVLTSHFGFFNVFHYVSFRCMAALLCSMLISFIFGGWFIKHSQRFFRSKSREYTPETHRSKDNMPTMGGIFIIFNIILTLMLCGNLNKSEIWICCFCLLSFWVYRLFR